MKTARDIALFTSGGYFIHMLGETMGIPPMPYHLAITLMAMFSVGAYLFMSRK